MSPLEPLSIRRLVVLDAPSNLGLRPPEPGTVPGCYKAPWVLRNLGLLQALQADDAGCVVPPRYRADWKPGDGDRNAEAIRLYSLELAQRMAPHVRERRPLLLLGGDCSILIGAAHALRACGRPGLVFMDAHSDFRHPGQADPIGAAAGEDLAIVTGRGDARLVSLGAPQPPFRDEDVFVVGIRDVDSDLEEMRQLGMRIATAADWSRNAVGSLDELDTWAGTRRDGFWVHLDLDVVDATEMPAADCPEPRGLSFEQVSRILAGLVRWPGFIGLDLTIYDPDLDPQGDVGRRIVRCLAKGLAPLRTPAVDSPSAGATT